MRIRRFNSTLSVNVPDKPKPRKTIKRVSAKQRARMQTLAHQKTVWVLTQFERFGFARCEGPCARPIFDFRDACLLLDGHHKRKRSLGGTDDPSNIAYLCRSCHMKEHGQ